VIARRVDHVHIPLVRAEHVPRDPTNYFAAIAKSILHLELFILGQPLLAIGDEFAALIAFLHTHHARDLVPEAG
jgi:hypothetical protein